MYSIENWNSREIIVVYDVVIGQPQNIKHSC